MDIKQKHHCNVIVLWLTRANMRTYHKPDLIGHSESRDSSLPGLALDEQCNIMTPWHQIRNRKPEENKRNDSLKLVVNMFLIMEQKQQTFRITAIYKNGKYVPWNNSSQRSCSYSFKCSYFSITGGLCSRRTTTGANP
ncbi:Hypothetical predicted protein, partial [Paramuricea clavata]